jgi:hypothetical protein
MLIAADWVIDSCGSGSKGERRYAWAWVATASRHHHLLIRRSLISNAKGVRELAFYLCFVPEGRPNDVAYPHPRGRSQVACGRRLPNRQRRVRQGPLTSPHVSSAASALGAGHGRPGRLRRHGRLLPHDHRQHPTGTHQPQRRPTPDPGPIPLTVAEVKRLVNLLTRSWHSLEHHLRWHLWRDVIEPVPAGSTSEPAWPADDQIAISDCRTREVPFDVLLPGRVPNGMWAEQSCD